MVVFDTNYLVLLLQNDLPPLLNPETRLEVQNVREKVEHLVGELNGKGTRILIPTPVLAEYYTRWGIASDAVFKTMNQSSKFQVVPFDERAAIEVGMMFHSAIQQGDKKSGSESPWQKVKYDRQIVAIARTNSASTVYSNDKDICKWSKELGMKAISVWDLKDPPPIQLKIEGSE
jgi:hypothetical protein